MAVPPAPPVGPLTVPVGPGWLADSDGVGPTPEVGELLGDATTGPPVGPVWAGCGGGADPVARGFESPGDAAGPGATVVVSGAVGLVSMDSELESSSPPQLVNISDASKLIAAPEARRARGRSDEGRRE